MIVNVSATHTAIVMSQLSRHDLLTWVNTTLKADFTKVDELCTGAAYCQLMHSLFPNMVPIKRVKFCTNIEHEFIDNFKILQTVFQKLQVQKAIPIDRLVRGKFQDNIEFLQWFKKFYDANSENMKRYDPVSVRNGQPMAYGSASMRKKPKFFSPRPHEQQPQHSYREEKNDEINEPYILKRSLTRTELRHDLSMSPNLVDISAGNEDLNQTLKQQHEMERNELTTIEVPQPEMELNTNFETLSPCPTHAERALERLLSYCLEAKATGKTEVEISMIKQIIDLPTDSEKLTNELENAAQLGAGDHVEVKDVVEEN